jgi:hypothetical protein
MRKIYNIIAILAVMLSAAAQSHAGLKLSPNPAQVEINGSMYFSVSGWDRKAALKWEVIPSSLGSIDDNGVFTAAGTSGQGLVRVIATKPDGQILLGHAMIKIVEKLTVRLNTSLSPDKARLRVKETLRFTSRILMPDGKPADNTNTEWAVIPDGLGSIDASGNFAALSAGKGRIVAMIKSGDARGLGQAAIEILPSEEIPSLSLVTSTNRIKVRTGEQAKIALQVKDLAGKPKEAKIRYSLSAEDLGIIDQDGNFTAGNKPGLGIIRIEAFAGDAYGLQRIFVVISDQKPSYKVKIKPRQVILEANSSIRFEVEVTDENGNQTLPPNIEWKLIPENLGSITPQGVLTAGDRAVSGRVVAKLPSQFGQGQDAASVKVSIKGRNTIRINPAKVNLRPGQMIQFTATVIDNRGRPSNDPRIIWKIAPENLGTITSQGLLTASQSPKSGTVIAEIPQEYGGGSSIAPVTVSSYQVKIDVPSNQYNIHTGEQIQFIALVRDANGNDLTGTASFEWDVKSSFSGFGSIDKTTGLFSAGHPVKLPADGYIMLRGYINGIPIGNDGLKITIK